MSSDSVKTRRLTRAEFRRACSQFATGITVVTTRAADGTPHGLTANSFTSVSADPPLVLVCIDLQCSVRAHFEENDHFAVNILTEDQRPVSVRFAENPNGRFDGIAWHLSDHGVPIIEKCLANFDCRIVDRKVAGDHLILIGQVEQADIFQGKPLVYFASSYQHLHLNI